jgi:hypothetical protein
MIPLPPDSLGPKPTKKQLDLLTEMVKPGVTVHRWHGTRPDSEGAYLRYSNGEGQSPTHVNCNVGTVEKYISWGWLAAIELDWRGNTYAATDRARKVVEKGVFRK